MQKYIDKAKRVHGDKYDYSDAVIADNKITYTCFEHGLIKQGLHHHVNRGSGCTHCYRESMKENVLEKNKKIIKDLIAIRGDKYDYSDAVIADNKITYTCFEHGLITQGLYHHIKRGSGCTHCYRESMKGRILEKNKDAIKDLIAIRGDKYDYSLSKYVSAKGLIKITCKEHGVFEQRYDHHKNGSDCQDCANNIRRDSLIMTMSDFLDKARKVHKHAYDYYESEVISRKNKLKIFCKTCASDYQQRVDLHLAGHGCPSCNTGETIGFKKSGFMRIANKNNNGYATFYILECFDDNERFYKVGITTKSVSARYPAGKMPYNYNVLTTIEASANDVWVMEKKYIKEGKPYHYTPLQPFGGHIKECFSKLPTFI